MSYVGTGEHGALNGLRVGMSLHTATNGQTVNKYDGGKETLIADVVIFDATYKGTAVELVKALCIKSYGGQLIASKASVVALGKMKECGVQRMGVCNLINIRQVELFELIMHGLPRRTFPSRSFQETETVIFDTLS